MNTIRQKHYRQKGQPTSKADRVTVGQMLQFDRAVEEARPPHERRVKPYPVPVVVNLPDCRVMLFDPHGVASGNGAHARRATMTRAIDDLTTRVSAKPTPVPARATGYRIV